MAQAFNEELDGMWADTQGERDDELAALRAEVKRAKGQRNEATILNKCALRAPCRPAAADDALSRRSLQRDLDLERGQVAVYRKLLVSNGLLPSESQ
jgi:hypothetical protein